jgi:hypothetical protein
VDELFINQMACHNSGTITGLYNIFFTSELLKTSYSNFGQYCADLQEIDAKGYKSFNNGTVDHCKQLVTSEVSSSKIAMDVVA